MMTERVARLRRESLEARPAISGERAQLVTEFYRGHDGAEPAPLPPECTQPLSSL